MAGREDARRGKEGRKPSDAAAAEHHSDTAADSNQQHLAFPQQTVTEAAAEAKTAAREMKQQRNI